jgi:phosphotransferase system enzyme I (PtsI)
VIAEPDKTALGLFEARLAASISSLVEPSQAGGSLIAETTDGKRFILKANLETAAEFARAKALGAEGVGLFRSEFLFLTGGAPPDEERQYAAYRAVIEAAAGLPVTVRTLDAGGDKAVPALADALPEANPLLGWRAIRFSLARPDIFKMQLRAILRASAHGKAALMFPLVCCYEELDAALALLDEAKRECSERGQPFDAQIPAGVMIELPAAALVAERLIERAAFFSIGTNDLLQYTLGVDRGNGRVNQLADPLHPAVLRLIRLTADAARSHGKSAAMCGEMAGDPALTRLLLGLGVDEFSMNAASIPEVRAVIRSSSLDDCRILADRVLSCGSASEARAML